MTLNLETKEKKFLLTLARQEIYNFLKVPFDLQEEVMPEELRLLYAGAFVSAYVNMQLRGCLGSFREDELLYIVVKKMAVNAISSDHRFTPVARQELDDLGIEISVLTPRKRIDTLKEIIPGKHGIYIVKGYQRGTLLPQVASEHDWDAETFVRYCSNYKAGLGWEGWKEAELYTYEAIVFSDFDKKNA